MNNERLRLGLNQTLLTRKPQNLSFVESFILSGALTCLSKTLEAPLERLKLLLQNQNELIRQGILTSEYSGVKDCLTKTFRSEGILSFWRGNLATVIKYVPYQGLNFALKDKIQGCLGTSTNTTKKELFAKNILSGGCAGSLALFVTYSMEYTRTRLAMDAIQSLDTQGRKFNGIIDCYIKTLKSDGIKGLYRGFPVSCINIFIYRGLYFGLYDSMKQILQRNESDITLLNRFSLGWGVTTFSLLAVYPLDTVKRRMMMTSGNNNIEKYSGSIDCLRQIVKLEGGSKALYRGAAVCMLKGAFGAGLLAGFDEVKNIYIGLRLRNNYL